MLQQHLTRKEQDVIILLDQLMHVDYELKRMVVKYPIIRDRAVLTDNLQQAVKMATALEKRLNRDGMRDAYNKCMKEFITRPCMRELPRDDFATWGGPINHISLHPVLKP